MGCTKVSMVYIYMSLVIFLMAVKGIQTLWPANMKKLFVFLKSELLSQSRRSLQSKQQPTWRNSWQGKGKKLKTTRTVANKFVMKCNFFFKHVGDLGNISADERMRAQFRLESHDVKASTCFHFVQSQIFLSHLWISFPDHISSLFLSFLLTSLQQFRWSTCVRKLWPFCFHLWSIWFMVVALCIQVWDVIGRSVVVTEHEDDLGKGNNLQSKIDGNSGKRFVGGKEQLGTGCGSPHYPIAHHARTDKIF